MPTIGPLHHHKPGTKAGRRTCSEQRSVCLSVSTTHASFAGEVQWKVSVFRAVVSVSRSSNPARSATQSRHFLLSPDLSQTVPKKRGNAPPFGFGSAVGERREANLSGEWGASSAFSHRLLFGVTPTYPGWRSESNYPRRKTMGPKSQRVYGQQVLGNATSFGTTSWLGSHSI